MTWGTAFTGAFLLYYYLSHSVSEVDWLLFGYPSSLYLFICVAFYHSSSQGLRNDGRLVPARKDLP